MEKVHGDSAWRLMQKYVHICAYLCISVYIRYISANICVYQSYIRAYIHISVHICAYMFISKNFILRGKNLIFRKKRFLVLNPFSKQAGLSAPQKIKNSHVCAQNRSQDLPVPCNSPNHLASTAVHIFHLILYIFLKHVHICLYQCISWHMQYEQI